MAVPLLDYNSVWAKIKAGFAETRLWSTPPKRPSYPYVDGRSSLTEEAQGTNGRMGMTPKGSVFGGKTFSERD